MSQWLTTRPTDPHWSHQAWEAFQIACQVHGVAALLHDRLHQLTWLPEHTRLWLTEQHDYNQKRMGKIHQELQLILAHFAAHDLAVMPLKGALLSVQTYPQPSLRPMADLDLLVRPDTFEQTATLLRRLGYEQDTVHWKHTAFIKPNNRQVIDKSCEHPDNPRPIELHCYCRETFAGPTLDLTDSLWQAARPSKLLDQEVWLPSAALLWLHLLVHASYHFWQGHGRLIHLVDLLYLTPQVENQASTLKQVDARYTLPSLSLLDRYFPLMLEQPLIAHQAAEVTSQFYQWAAGLDLVNSSYLNPEPRGLYFMKALRFVQGKPKGRPPEILQVLRFSFLPSLDEISLDHPQLAASPWPWVAYFLLPLDWAKRLWRGFL